MFLQWPFSGVLTVHEYQTSLSNLGLHVVQVLLECLPSVQFARCDVVELRYRIRAQPAYATGSKPLCLTH